ncbi:hypothetical protein [Saccharomonospora cyanea]|uniref:hypothetical protein n=1 Tax=Saccharomonospora cyanea TaxID=40989 RepID=UPI001E2DADC9|nr:hypothetical protein [Saccharomonospora cyanea]
MLRVITSRVCPMASNPMIEALRKRSCTPWALRNDGLTTVVTATTATKAPMMLSSRPDSTSRMRLMSPSRSR